MSKENVLKYKELIESQMKSKKQVVAFELRDCANIAELYNSNSISRLAKELQLAAVEIARLEGEINVLNQLLGSEEE